MQQISSPFPEEVAFVALHLSEIDPAELEAQHTEGLSEKAVQSRRLQFKLGRAAAARALKSLGFEPPPVVGKGPHRQPLWPPGVAGSITHSEHTAVAAVSRTGGLIALGLDLENAGRRVSPALARRIGSESENELLANEPDGVLMLFSAKEAVFKALFPRCGKYFGFKDAELLYRGGGKFKGCLLRELGDSLPRGFSLLVRVDQYGSLLLSSIYLRAGGS